MRLQSHAEAERRALALRALSPPVLRVLALTRLDGQFAVETDAP